MKAHSKNKSIPIESFLSTKNTQDQQLIILDNSLDKFQLNCDTFSFNYPELYAAKDSAIRKAAGCDAMRDITVSLDLVLHLGHKLNEESKHSAHSAVSSVHEIFEGPVDLAVTFKSICQTVLWLHLYMIPTYELTVRLSRMSCSTRLDTCSRIWERCSWFFDVTVPPM